MASIEGHAVSSGGSGPQFKPRVFFPQASAPPAPSAPPADGGSDHDTTPSDEQTAVHEQLLGLTAGIERVLRGLDSSSSIEEDLHTAQWQLKQCALLVEGAVAGLSADNIAPDQRMGWMQLMRCHTTLLRDLNHEATEKESKLAGRIEEQKRFKKLHSSSFAVLHAEAVEGGNPFVYDIDDDESAAAGANPPHGELREVRLSIPADATSSRHSYANSGPALALPAAQYLGPRSTGLSRFNSSAAYAQAPGGAGENPPYQKASKAADANSPMLAGADPQAQPKSPQGAEPGAPPSKKKSEECAFTARQRLAFCVGLLILLLVAFGILWSQPDHSIFGNGNSSAVVLTQGESSTGSNIDPITPAESSTGGDVDPTGGSVTSSSTASAILTPPFSQCDVSSISLADLSSGVIYPWFIDSPDAGPSFVVVPSIAAAQVATLQLRVDFVPGSALAPLSSVTYMVSPSTELHELESSEGDDSVQFVSSASDGLVGVSVGSNTILIDTDCVTTFGLALTVLPPPDSSVSSSTGSSDLPSSTADAEPTPSSTAESDASTGVDETSTAPPDSTPASSTADSTPDLTDSSTAGSNDGVDNGDVSTAPAVDPTDAASTAVDATTDPNASTAADGEVTTTSNSTAVDVTADPLPNDTEP